MNSTRKVLVVGADPGTVSLYSSYLEAAGFSVDSASADDPILEALRDSEPEAVLLDMSSSSPSEEEALSHIRSHPTFSALPSSCCRTEQELNARMSWPGIRD